MLFTVFISGLFVDVGENASVLDRISLTFIYEEIGSVEQTAEDLAEEVTMHEFNHNSTLINCYVQSAL